MASRRRFLGSLGAGVAGVSLAATTTAACARDEEGKDEPKRKAYKGTSKKGNFQEALDAAIDAALKAAPGADRLVSWSLKDTSGRKGGIVGFNEVTVTIEATFS